MDITICSCFNCRFHNYSIQMRAVIQRVNRASVTVAPDYHEEIGHGLLVLLGIEQYDTLDDAIWLANKIINLRIFGDSIGLMNLSIEEVKGEIMIISQFTLYLRGSIPVFDTIRFFS